MERKGAGEKMEEVKVDVDAEELYLVKDKDQVNRNDVVGLIQLKLLNLMKLNYYGVVR